MEHRMPQFSCCGTKEQMASGTVLENTITLDETKEGNWSKWDGESEIASTATHHITLVECDQNYKAVRSGDVAVTVNPGA